MDQSDDQIFVNYNFVADFEYGGLSELKIGAENFDLIIGRTYDGDCLDWGVEDIDLLLRAVVRTDITTFIDDFRDHNISKDFYLMQNYPNPFNPNTTISSKFQKEVK
jgi:hypothetical protein